MSIQFRIKTAIFICLSAAVTVSAFAQGGGEQNPGRTIEVTGYGSAQGSPDLAIVRLGVESRSVEVKTAIGDTTASMNAVLAAVKATGVADKDIATVSYNVSFLPAGNDPPNRAASGMAGTYRVADVAAITVRDLKKLARVLDGAVAAGANSIQGISFEISDPSRLAEQARSAAMADAASRAEQLAQLASAKLGKVISVTESGGGPRPGEPLLRAAAFSGAPPVSPGQLSLSVNVRVVYALE